MIRIGFWGTPVLAQSVLEDIFRDSRFEVAFVVTNPDTAIGRSQELRESPVKAYAKTQNIPIFQPERVRGNTEFFEQIETFHCEYFIVVAYGKILPKEILDMPQKMCINIHGSLLPKYRGASPIQSALLHGEEETGVTIMQMSEGMDEGGIILTKNILIIPTETSGSLFEKFGDISGTTLIDAILGLEEHRLTVIPQDHDQATYCQKIEKQDGKIDWSLSAKAIYHRWQAYTPWPGIFTLYQGKRLLLEKVEYQEDTFSGDIGQVVLLLSGSIGVVCGEGILTLKQVKLEGRTSQDIRDFVNGNQSFISSVL